MSLYRAVILPDMGWIQPSTSPSASPIGFGIFRPGGRGYIFQIAQGRHLLHSLPLPAPSPQTCLLRLTHPPSVSPGTMSRSSAKRTLPSTCPPYRGCMQYPAGSMVHSCGDLNKWIMTDQLYSQGQVHHSKQQSNSPGQKHRG